MNRKQEAQNTYSQHIKFRPAASLFSPSSLYCFLTQAYTCLFCYVKMIALKSIHPFFTPIYIKYNIHRSRCLNTKDSVLCLCKSNQSESQAPQPGDIRKQELLAQIAMLQTQKVRLTDYFDERSEYLTQFGEEAKAEFDKIGKDALQGLDEASARVCYNFWVNHVV